MPRYDMKCFHCDHFIEDVVIDYVSMKQMKCPACGEGMESVPTSITINTSASLSFVRVPPERKAEIAYMRESHKRTRTTQKEQREVARKRREGH